MNIGSTTEDIDGVPIDRGPPEEDRRTEAELRGAMQDISKARKSMGEIATVKGVQEQIVFVQHQMDEVLEQNNRLVGLYETLRREFDQFKAQRAIELNMKVNHGPTSTED